MHKDGGHSQRYQGTYQTVVEQIGEQDGADGASTGRVVNIDSGEGRGWRLVTKKRLTGDLCIMRKCRWRRRARRKRGIQGGMSRENGAQNAQGNGGL